MAVILLLLLLLFLLLLLNDFIDSRSSSFCVIKRNMGRGTRKYYHRLQSYWSATAECYVIQISSLPKGKVKEMEGGTDLPITNVLHSLI